MTAAHAGGRPNRTVPAGGRSRPTADGHEWIDLPFVSRVNPHTGQLGQRLAEWVSAAGVLDACGGIRWPGIRLERLAGRMYPTATAATLELAGRFVVWLFLYDDHLDPGKPGDRPEHASKIAQDVAGLVRGAPASPGEHVVVALVRQWCDDIADSTSADWWRRCSADLDRLVRSIADEVHARARQSSPDVEAYLAHRRLTSGWGVLTDLIEIAEEAELPRQLREAETFQHLRWTAGDVACTVNDLLSLRKEVDAGESHNLVLVLRRTEHCDLPAAVARAQQWLLERLGDYLSTRDRLLASCAEGESQALTRYAAGLENLMRGSVDWSLETSRYAPAAPPRSGMGDDEAEPVGKEK